MTKLKMFAAAGALAFAFLALPTSGTAQEREITPAEPQALFKTNPDTGEPYRRPLAAQSQGDFYEARGLTYPEAKLIWPNMTQQEFDALREQSRPNCAVAIDTVIEVDEIVDFIPESDLMFKELRAEIGPLAQNVKNSGWGRRGGLLLTSLMVPITAPSNAGYEWSATASQNVTLHGLDVTAYNLGGNRMFLRALLITMKADIAWAQAMFPKCWRAYGNGPAIIPSREMPKLARINIDGTDRDDDQGGYDRRDDRRDSYGRRGDRDPRDYDRRDGYGRRDDRRDDGYDRDDRRPRDGYDRRPERRRDPGTSRWPSGRPRVSPRY